VSSGPSGGYPRWEVIDRYPPNPTPPIKKRGYYPHNSFEKELLRPDKSVEALTREATMAHSELLMDHPTRHATFYWFFNKPPASEPP